MTLNVITREELQQRLGQLILIEALPETHYNLEHIPTAINLPNPPTAETARDIAPNLDAAIVVYCSGLSCTRSRATAVAFQKLEGGKADWEAAGLAFEGERALTVN